MSKRLLVLGDHSEQIAEEFPGYELQAADPFGWGFMARPKSPCRFNVIYASMVLQRVPYREVVATLKEWAGDLKPGGEMYITVPSLEWAAVQIISEKPLPVIMPFLFGNQGNEAQFYKSGFMLAALRNLVVAAGLEVRTAAPFQATVQMGNEEYKVEQLMVLAVKPARPRKRRRKR